MYRQRQDLACLPRSLFRVTRLCSSLQSFSCGAVDDGIRCSRHFSSCKTGLIVVPILVSLFVLWLIGDAPVDVDANRRMRTTAARGHGSGSSWGGRQARAISGDCVSI